MQNLLMLLVVGALIVVACTIEPTGTALAATMVAGVVALRDRGARR